MLISTRRKFLFVANLKTASTSIERALRPYADIAIGETRLGKHLTLEQIARRYHWLFSVYPLESFFVFGVMREPIDYLVSLYNAHHLVDASEQIPGQGLPPSTVGLPFDDFVRNWSRASWQAQEQRLMFQFDGRVAINALIDLDSIEWQFPALMRRLGIDATLGHFNRSPEVLEAGSVSPETRAFVMERYAEDYAFRERYAGRLLGPEGWTPIQRPEPVPRPSLRARIRSRLARLAGRRVVPSRRLS